MTSTNRNMLLIFTAAVATRLVFHCLTGFTADDAYITFRYAENIALGHGFVYNLGERVMGTSTPLFTLLLAVLALIRVPVEQSALFVSLVSSGLTAAILYRFAQSLRFTRLSWLPALCYILWPRSLPADTCGMETAFFTMLVTAAFYYQHKRRDIYAIGMATLAAATRPEGFGLLALMVFVNWYRNPHRWREYLTAPAILLVPWLIFAHYYFGSMIPNSVTAKIALYSQGWGTLPIWETLVLLLGWHSPLGWLMTIAAVIGAWWLNRKQYHGWLEIVWLLAMFAFYTFNGAHIFFWYIVPVYPLYLLFATAAVVYAFDRIPMVKSTDRIWRAAVMGATIVALAAASYRPVRAYADNQHLLDSVHRKVGDYLLTNADHDDIIAAEDIGYMGFFSRKRILDRDGLVSPEAVEYNRDGRYRELIMDFSPEWVVASTGSPISGFITDSVFLSVYSRDTSFEAGGEEYGVFTRPNREPNP